ncbi:unnamed protein product [Cyprideis torosa]|uniref:4-alpha-glucanotransferase n=1 Tax=Cyprideis torosa TaxID=163714 RepID=A0A7R8W2M8_9CRUS|nr:unnamed protein product [Cyprideis torosa]CAG0878761.1 unnamed protein product [Cyprideis torosa]
MKIVPEERAKRTKYYIQPKLVSELTRNTLVLVLAGGEGSRLKSLTKWRAKPAVPFGGKYRIIDFALSNCVNSGLRRIGVLCQYKSHSLILHLQRAWSFMRAEIGEFVEILPAQQRTGKNWYQGTADALYQNLDIMQRHGSEYVLVLGGDHIYKTDFSALLVQHSQTAADLTVCCIEVPREEATAFGVMSVDEDLNITSFNEKPEQPDTIPGDETRSLVSMGIYVFSTRYLYECLINDANNPASSHDFGKDIIPKAIQNCKTMAYRFCNAKGEPDYWKDVGTLDSYWSSNMELCDVDPKLNLYDRNWPIWTYQTHYPPAKFIFNRDGCRGHALDSLISAGCIISGAEIEHSVIFSASRVERRSQIRNCVILQNVDIEAGLSVWQVLPLGVPQAGGSPYQCDSAFALNPELFPSECLPDMDLQNPDYTAWASNHGFWLNDYALFATIKNHFDNKAWFDWPEEFRRHHGETLDAFSKDHREDINVVCWQQYCLYKHWQKVRNYAREKNIYIFGDMPIFVAHDSADVWAKSEYFLLDENGHPEVVAGVPPDYFSKTGQRWGNPHYNWDRLKEIGFDWWKERIRAHFECFDIVRIDHFRGLDSVWEINASCETAIEGQWISVPGDELLASLSDNGTQLQLVAEDLGLITPEVTALRHKYHLPGMAVLQFAFDDFEDNPHKPKNMTPNTVAYSGTHDNDTTAGWFFSLDQDYRNHILNLTGAVDESQLVDTIINIVLESAANLAIIPLQDFLGLGSDARMNTPGTVENNWRWRYQAEQLNPELAARIKNKLITYGRLM